MTRGQIGKDYHVGSSGGGGVQVCDTNHLSTLGRSRCGPIVGSRRTRRRSMPFKRSLASQAGVAPPTRPRLTLLHEGFALAPATRALTEKPASAASVASPATPGGGPRERGSGEPKPYGRGSAEAAISAAQDPQQCRMELAKDVLAETTKGPTASRQKLWATLAKTAGWLDPFHLDPSMIFTIMGALKRGGYRSAQLYLDTAKNCHIALGFTWDDQLQQAYRSAVRSCKRGIGHPKQAAHLPLDKVALIDYEPALVNGGPQFPVAATVLASWWLLREIEASRARRKHIEIDETNQKVTWRLPSSKTDQAALGAARSHTCACSLHRKELCPYHVAVEHLNKLPPGPDQYIFPAADGHSSTKKGWADAFEALAKILEIPITHQNGARAFTGHTARVSGARFMATNNIELWRIQLFRRWGSEVFLHYIQDAPLAQLDMLALESTAAMSVHKAREELELLQRRIKDCKASFMAPELDMLEDCAASVHLTHQEENLPGVTIFNTSRGGRYHCTLIYKLDIHPKRWRTRCGWPFGRNQAEYRVCESLNNAPIHLRCVKCFPRSRTADPEPCTSGSEISVSSNEPCASDASGT